MIDAPPGRPPSPEQIIEQRLVGCGLEIGGVSVRYEDYLQGFEIVIHKSAGATASHFGCIRNAAGYETVMFEDPDMYRAYSDYETKLTRPQMLESWKTALQERGLFEDFPVRGDFESLDRYAKALEEHGGIAPGSTLRVSEDGILFDPPRDETDPAALLERYSNLMAIIAYASARDGMRFGFIGNEAVSEKQGSGR